MSDKDKIVYSQKPNENFYKEVVVLAGSSNDKLAKDICAILGMEQKQVHTKRFNDGELDIRIKDSVRGKDVFLIQSTCPPVNENLVELLLTISALRRSSAKSINVLIPYYGYARQDRKMKPRVPISAADVAKLIEAMGADRVMTIDLHSGQAQGFFSVPVDNLEAQSVAVKYFIKKIKKMNNDAMELVVVSPDAGGVTRAKQFQEQLKKFGSIQSDLAIILKNRDAPGSIGDMHLVGNVANKDVIIIDDMIDSGGTLVKAVEMIKQSGANRVYCFATHALFSGTAVTKLENSQITEVIVTDTIPQKAN